MQGSENAKAMDATPHMDDPDGTARDRRARALVPLAYHQALVDYFKRAEPEVWAWASSLSVQTRHAQELRSELLRKTYRLPPGSHPQVHALCNEAMQRLGIEAAVSLYQAGDGAMGASLWFLPGEAHVVFAGAVLERLDPIELSALLGHELAHYKLWSLADGDYHTAQRILDHCLADPQAAPSHAESARRYSLHTEIFADRGAAVAAQAALPAVAILVKVHTGLGNVDPTAYLGQAEQLERDDPRHSQGDTHPEAYLRAQALDRWWRDGDDGEALAVAGGDISVESAQSEHNKAEDSTAEHNKGEHNKAQSTEAWLRRRLQGPLSLDRLDLLDQVELRELTRRFIARLLSLPAVRGDAARQQARGYFPDWSEHEPIAEDVELAAERIDDSVRRYLYSVMLDFALIDADQRAAALFEVAGLAARFGERAEFMAALKRDAGLGKRELDKLSRRLDQEVAA